MFVALLQHIRVNVVGIQRKYPSSHNDINNATFRD